jgi:hypothetical protein
MRPLIGAAIRKYIDAGFDHIVLTQIGPDQKCLRLFENELAGVAREEQGCCLNSATTKVMQTSCPIQCDAQEW